MSHILILDQLGIHIFYRRSNHHSLLAHIIVRDRYLLALDYLLKNLIRTSRDNSSSIVQPRKFHVDRNKESLSELFQHDEIRVIYRNSLESSVPISGDAVIGPHEAIGSIRGWRFSMHIPSSNHHHTSNRTMRPTHPQQAAEMIPRIHPRHVTMSSHARYPERGRHRLIRFFFSKSVNSRRSAVYLLASQINFTILIILK